MSNGISASEYRALVGTKPQPPAKPPAKTTGTTARLNDQPTAAVLTPQPKTKAASTPQTDSRTEDKKAEDRKDARLRPWCQLADYPGFRGHRIVAGDLTPDQARALLAAARAAGIAVAADAEDTLHAT